MFHLTTWQHGAPYGIHRSAVWHPYRYDIIGMTSGPSLRTTETDEVSEEMIAQTFVTDARVTLEEIELEVGNSLRK
jgi:hypothetical protein